jgi:hypothetical protein
MYQVINADCVLATVLASRDNVTLDCLEELRRRIEGSCPGVAVDVSSPAIDSAVECYPEIFERQRGRIARAANADRYLASDYLKWKFTNRIPPEIRQAVEMVIRDIGSVVCS